MLGYEYMYINWWLIVGHLNINAAIRNLRCLYCTCERNFHGAFMVWTDRCVHHKCDMIGGVTSVNSGQQSVLDDQIHDRVLDVILYTLIFS